MSGLKVRNSKQQKLLKGERRHVWVIGRKETTRKTKK
jgi:hypothetical protein